MLRKMCRGLYLFLFVVLLAGGFCFLPNFNSSLSKADNENLSLSSQMPNEMPTSKWEELRDKNFMSEMNSSGVSIYGHDNVIQVESAEQLSEIAYKVNHGDEAYVNGVFFVTADISLAGSLWTPIGSQSSPFRGVFYGNGRIISNISIDTITTENNSGVGLFGNISGATITDIRLGGWSQVNVPSNITVGSLIGISENSYIINCYDECTSKVNQSGSSFNTIGSIDTNSYIFLGASYDGNNVVFNSLEAMKTAVTYAGEPNYGIVGFYKSNGGIFRFGNKDWYDTTTYRTLLVPDDQNNGEELIAQKPAGCKANLYVGAHPVLRCETENEQQVYILNQGSKPSIEIIDMTYVDMSDESVMQGKLIKNGFISTITYDSEATTSVTLNYGYGKRTLTVNFKYDQPFASFFQENSGYKLRAGYEFNGLYSDEGKLNLVNSENADDYKLSYPVERGEYYFDWTWIDLQSNQRSFDVMFAYASDEGGKIVSSFMQGSDFRSIIATQNGNVKVTGLEDLGDGNGSILFRNNQPFALNSDSYQFGLSIKSGYRISAILEKNTSVANIDQSFKADKVSGAYVNFTNNTGVDGAYSDVSKNNDYYNSVSISGTWDNEADYNTQMEKGANIDKDYTFTVENVVGAGGVIVLVIERDYIGIDITPNLTDDMTEYAVELLTDEANIHEGLSYLEVNGEKDADTSKLNKNDKVVLYSRRNENAKYKIKSLTSSRYILNFTTEKLSLRQEGDDAFATYQTKVSVGAGPAFEGIADEDNYFNMWDINLYNVFEYGSAFKVYIGTINTKVAINLYLGDESNRVLLPDLAGTGVSINDSTYFTSSTGDLFGMSNSGEIKVKKNGKYEAFKAVVTDNETNQASLYELKSMQTESEIGQYVENYYLTGIVLTAGNMLFKKAFSHEDEAIYTLDVYFKERTYDIAIEYYVGENLVATKPSEDAPAVISKESVVNINANNYSRLFETDKISFGYLQQLPSVLKDNSKYYFTYQLTTVGQGAISYRGYELFQDGKLKYGFGNSTNPEAWERDGFENSVLTEPENIGSADEQRFELSLGGYDTTIKIYFEYRNVNLSIDKLHVENEEGYLGVDDNAIIAYMADNLSYLFGVDGSLSLSNGQNALNGISIHSQFYLLGWYLQNGQTINVNNNGNFNDILSDTNFVNAVAEFGAGREGTYTFNGIAALVARRTISVSYTAGEAGEGELYVNKDNRLDYENKVLEKVENGAISPFIASTNLRYNEEISLTKYAFFNLGHKFSYYKPNGVTANGVQVLFGNVDTTKNSYVINAEGWDELFKQAIVGEVNVNNIGGDSFQVWNGLADLEEHRSASVELIANWDIIQYSGLIDGKNVVSDVELGKTGISIGDTIFYTTTPEPNHKNGLAVYNIGSAVVSGEALYGYLTVGYNISQDTSKEPVERLGSGEDKALKLTPEIFKQFIKDGYRFMENAGDDPINITTLRTPADYLIYLDNSENSYYTYQWNEALDGENNFGQKEGDIITINVKYGSPAQNLIDAINNNVLSVERVGYRLNGWAIATGGNQTSKMFIPSDNFSSTTDIHIVPTWTRVDKATKSEISFRENIGNVRDFYLAMGQNIVSTKISGSHIDNSNINLSNKPILKNGEQVTNYRIVLTLDGEDIVYDRYIDFDIGELMKSGSYSIRFEVDIKDTLTRFNENGAHSIEYTSQSAELVFNMIKNEFYILDNNFSTIYNGTNEFVPSQTNDYGIYMFKYDWDGTDLTENSSAYLNNLEEYFGNFEVAGNDFNASQNENDKKPIKFYLKADPSDTTKYEDAISNIKLDEKGYYFVFDNVVTIEKAVFTIQFENGSAYYFDGVKTIVYTNNKNNQFTVGNVDFSYTYNQITLKDGAKPSTYTGSENHNIDITNFELYGLEIEGHASDLDKNFEWNIANYANTGDSRFILRDTTDAIGYTYKPAYLTAQNGKLSGSLSNSYLAMTDTIYLSNLLINGEVGLLNNSNQGNIIIDNEILFSYVGNGTRELKLFVNKDALSRYSFTVDVNIRLDSERQKALKLLQFTNDESVTKLADAFDGWVIQDYKTTLMPSFADSTTSYLAVLTDVVKINVNYNTGSNANNEENETIYVGLSSGSFSLANPTTVESSYLTFNGYNKSTNSKLDIVIGGNNAQISNREAGATETITAKWSFIDFTFNVDKDLVYDASADAIEQSLSEFITLNAPNASTFTISMVGKKNLISFGYNSSSSSFTIADANGQASVQLNDRYLVTVVYTYNDGFGAQTLTKEREVELTLTRRTIDFNFVNDDLTFNNALQNVSINLDLDGQTRVVNLQAIPQVDDSINNGLRFHISIVNSLGLPSELRNADTYTITAIIDSNMTGVYQFGDNVFNKVVSLTIKQDTIKLAEYTNEFNFNKYFGLDDPELVQDITIVKNSDDKVAIFFEREEGEAIGRHKLTNPTLSEEDEKNYDLDLTDFISYFEILTPSGNLKVEINEPIKYTYNGYTVTGYEISLNDKNYTLSLTYGEGNVATSVTFDLYYLSGENKIQIPDSVKSEYADFIEFSSNNIEAISGSYDLEVMLTANATNANWAGVDFANEEAVKIEIEKKDLVVNSITKVYNQLSNFTFNTLGKNSDSEIELTGLVDYGTSADEVEIKGTLNSANAGKRTILNLSINGDIGRGASYNLIYDKAMLATILADSESDVILNTSLTNIGYGQITDRTSLNEILGLFGFTFSASGKSLDSSSFTITEFSIEEARYSTGKYLNAGSYIIRFKVTSKDYTFKASLADIDATYDKIYEKTLTVDKKAITVTNDNRLSISKPYDGNISLTDSFVGMNVNGEGSYYISNDMLAGDILNVVSGTYENSIIGKNKVITLVFAQVDSQNYTITQNIVGEIANVVLYFDRVGDSKDILNTLTGQKEADFVNDGVTDFENAGIARIEYDGNIITLIDNIIIEGNRVRRTGYTSTGYTFFNGTERVVINSSMSEKDKEILLQMAVDAGRTGLDIDAIWERNNYQIQIVIGHGKLTDSYNAVLSSITLPYYNDGVEYTIATDEGYKFTSFVLSKDSAIINVLSGQNTNSAVISIEKITDDFTLTISPEEIRVRIILDYNEPSGFVASTDDPVWAGKTDLVLSYSQLTSTNLPVLTMNRGYNPKYWTLNNAINNGENLWERINGRSFTKDELDGITFVQQWNENEIEITITSPKGSVKVYNETDGGRSEIVVNGNGKFTVLFSHNIIIEVTADEFYKWTSFTSNGSYTRIEGEANNRRTGEIKIVYIQDATSINFTLEPMRFTFNGDYVVPEGTSIVDDSINGEFMIVSEAGKDNSSLTLSDIFGGKEFSASIDGTYYQNGWTMGANKFALNEKVTDVIKKIIGDVPNEERYGDNGFTLMADFAGYEYTVTFDKTNARPGMDFMGLDQGTNPVIRKYVYGQVLTNVPVLNSPDEEYVWRIKKMGSDGKEIIETFEEGQLFVTPNFANSSLSLALEAEWGLLFRVTITVEGNTDKLIDIDGTPYEEEIRLRYFNGANRTFRFNFKEGYEIGKVTGFEGEDDVVISGNSLTINELVGGALNNRNVVVNISPKSYKVTIVTNDYYTLNNSNITDVNNQFTISYDEIIDSKFNKLEFIRSGYHLIGLRHNGNPFATLGESGFTFENGYVDENGRYCYDNALTLTAVWEVDDNYAYLSAVTTAKTNLVYNGQEKAVASSTIYVDGKSLADINGTLKNGERIKEVYYMFSTKADAGIGDFIKTGYSNDFELIYKNAFQGKAYLVVVLEDTLSGFTHEVRATKAGEEIAINIAKASIAISGAKLESYYTGTKSYVATSNDSTQNSQGQVKFTTGEENGELAIERVELIDESGLYSADARYCVRYFFNPVGFDMANYNGLSRDGGLITYDTDDSLTAFVKKAQIIVKFNEKGFEKGTSHAIREFSFDMIGGGSNFKVNITSITTKDVISGNYDDISQFEIISTITNENDEDRKSNFEFVINGGFEIVSAGEAYKTEIATRYFDTATLTRNVQNIVKISSISLDGEDIIIPNGDYNYSNGDLIITVVKNGTGELNVLVSSGANVKFNLVFDGEMEILSWTSLGGENQVSELLSQLKVLSQPKDEFITFVTDESISTYVAIITDYKAIRLNLGDLSSITEEGDIGYTFVRLGADVALSDPETILGDVKGFKFSQWLSQTNGITIQGLKAIADADATIIACEINALWLLENPVATSQDIDFDAKVELDGLEEISLSQILSGGKITNINNLIDYTYKITKDGKEIISSGKFNQIENAETFSLPTNTNSNGVYKLVITANRENYAPTELELTFEVTVNRLVLSGVEFSSTNFTYHNKDFIPEIDVTIFGGGLTTEKLADLLNKQNSSYYFTLSGKSENEIKLAGDYLVNFVADKTIFDLESLNVQTSYEFIVEQAEIIIGMEEIPAELKSKLFATNDPNFSFTINMFEGENDELVNVKLTRKAGEVIGQYEFISGTSENDNYFVTIAEDTYFTIEQSHINLKVTIDDQLSMVYSKHAPEFILTYDELAGKWKVTIGQSSSFITLSYVNNEGETVVLTGDINRLALVNLSFTALNAIDVDSYDQSDITIAGKGNFESYTLVANFEITPLTLVMTGINKIFDRTDIIGKSDAKFINVIEGDEVYMTGRYSQIVVGNNIELLDVQIEGSSIGNYFLPAVTYFGNITPREVESVTFDITNKIFSYGQIKNGISLQDLLSLAQGYTFSIGTITDDIENGYVTISGISLSESELSNGGYLNAGGSRSLTFMITSSNFTGLQSNGYTILVEVTEFELDLSSLEIIKKFDEKTSLPKSLDENIDRFILSGDEVSIDKAKGGYQNAQVGDDKKVTIVLKGSDSANYKVKDNVTGSITEFTINLTVNASTEHADLVTGGKFVADGLSPVGDNTTFTVGYPIKAGMNEESLIASFPAPSRKGYAFRGWKIEGENGYVTLDKTNVTEVLRNLALNSLDEEPSITIYSVWEIEKYAIVVEGAYLDNVKFEAVPSTAISQIGGETYVEYFTNLDITIESQRGYKIRSYNLMTTIDAINRNLTDIGKNIGKVSFTGIASAIELGVAFDEINVTFAINVNLPEFTNRTDTNSLNPSYGYSSLALLSEEDLPKLKVTEGTYTLTNYTYQNGKLDGKTLQDIVDEMFATLENDVTIELNAVWQGLNYEITFDPTDGKINGSNTVRVRYGEVISTFPTALLDGRVAIWTAPDGRSYVEGDRLASIGTNEDDIYRITFTATWQNAPFDITINFVSGITVKVDGKEIESGKTFTLIYNEDSLELEVLPITGYVYAYDKSTVAGKINEERGRVIIRDLINDCQLEFTREPAPNELKLFTTNVESFTVKINGQEVEARPTIIAYTEQKVEITYKAKKGYEFTLTSYKPLGNGDFTPTISEDKKTLTIVWENFVAGATISVDGEASINEVTIGDVRDLFMRLTFNTANTSTNINLSGDTFYIKTGERFDISAVMAYGYTGGRLNTGNVDYVVEGSVNNYYSQTDNYYYFTATIAGFDESFAIEFSAVARKFNFSVSVLAGQEKYGEITCDPIQQGVDFGTAIKLSQRELIENFEFVGWKIGDNVISTLPNTDYVISSAIKDALESAGEDGIVEIFATYARKIREISLTATGKGSFTASQEVEVFDEALQDYKQMVISTDVNGSTSFNFYLGEDLTITIKPNNGYELSYILIDGERVSQSDLADKYHFDGTNIIIPLDLYNPIRNVEVVFKASQIKVSVQAGTIINYIDNLGTDAGGHIYVTDAQGNRIEDGDRLLDFQGKYIPGANYRFVSYTDETLYFEVEANSGFTASIIGSLGMTIGTQVINGKTLYVVTGALDGSQVTVLFTAKENNVRIIFSNEGEEIKSVHGGVISVDTSSALVSASPNRGDNIKASIVTGASLSMEINALISYSLVTDENGLLKYDIIYDNDESYSNVKVEKVEDRDPMMTGFNNSSAISISQVNTSATIIIYVQPREYNIKFVVDEFNSVVMSEKIRYGEEWSLDSLTASEKAIVFASRKDYTFTGYYTSTNSYGTQYIDRYGEITQNWQHSGYTFDGTSYQKDYNYDPSTDTFTLYAGWVYNKASIRMEVNPISIIEGENYSIYSFSSNLASYKPWISQDDLYYAELAVGSTVNFVAPEIEGYIFSGFTLQFENGQIIDRGKTFDLKLEMGDYIIRANYNPTITINIANANNDKADGGTSFARQDGGTISGSFDTNKLISLVAVPAKGYNFLYWIDNNSGEKLFGERGTNGEFVYTYSDYVDHSLNLTAVFEGKTIEVNFDGRELNQTHSIKGVTVNGVEVDYSAPFNANVGDTLVVRVVKSRGYGFNNSLFESIYDSEGGCYVFSYTFAEKDLVVVNDSSYRLEITIPVTREDITFKFNVSMSKPIDSSEVGRSGSLYVVSGNKDTLLYNGSTRTIKYGDTIIIKTVANTNYKFEKAYFIINDTIFDVSDYVQNGQIQINKDLMDKYFDYQVTLNVYFTRLIWIDEDSRSSELSGSGTDADPYIIKSARDMALVAFLVNNGLENGEGIKYSSCSYKVTNNINFEGRYWEPIGTKENPFSGKMDIGKYHLKNITLYKSYTSPRPSHGGLFWHISKDAKIIVNNKTITIVIIIISILIFLIILLIILILLLLKRRKKKMEELANQ